MTDLLTAFNVFILVYFALLNGTYLILSLTAFRSLRRYIDRLESLQIDDLLASSGGLPISLVVERGRFTKYVGVITGFAADSMIPIYSITIRKIGRASCRERV